MYLNNEWNKGKGLYCSNLGNLKIYKTRLYDMPVWFCSILGFFLCDFVFMSPCLDDMSLFEQWFEVGECSIYCDYWLSSVLCQCTDLEVVSSFWQDVSDSDSHNIVLSYLVHNCFKETVESFIGSTGIKQPANCLEDIDRRKSKSHLPKIFCKWYFDWLLVLQVSFNPHCEDFFPCVKLRWSFMRYILLYFFRLCLIEATFSLEIKYSLYKRWRYS